MLKRLTTLVLIVVFSGVALAGNRLRCGESVCGEKKMSGHECCRTTEGRAGSAGFPGASSCCVTNCTQPAPPDPVRASEKLTVQPLDLVAPHSAVVPASAALPIAPLNLYEKEVHHFHSNPAYILHLELLI